MRITAVESTVLVTVGYDEARELLQVEFCGRAIYHYFGVPAAIHQTLLGAFEGQLFQSGDSRTLSVLSDL